MTPVSAIDGFLRRAGRAHRVARALRAALLHALWAIAIAAVVDLWLADRRLTIVAVVAGWCALQALRTWQGSRLSVARVDAELALGDALETWAHEHARAPLGAPRPMWQWLERRLEQRLTGLAPRAAVRGRPTRWRAAVVVLALALALRWLLGSLPLPDGVLTVAGPPSVGVAPRDGPGEPAPGAGDTPAPRPRVPEPVVPEVPDAPPRRPDPPPRAADEPPSALIDGLPLRDDFAVPHFVADGPSRQAEAVVAEVGAPADRAAGTGDVTGDDAAPATPEERYQRALEQALRSRHVPANERAVVRRYFELLQGSLR